ncbi:TetR/AcrR family transcriptional regulator [Desulfovibrio sp. TomC]|uniref:TetR/AcrR family transcriptional regulator n=1 Tax=Desulfovibrio sp. TomC TaxID=1562888 RepID=UPI00057568B9|nr:CerR family C-terminal domain-containing protein [Desulfovibrio sp. TomC]KHK04553.1 Transcriptional regulator, TetR family [Desulfovibrio sp. TomC]
MAEEPSGVKERLFWAALRTFAAKGYKGATVRDICQAAGGANLNAVQYYYGGKDKLYQAVLAVLFTEGDRRLRQRLAEGAATSAEDRLRLLLKVYCQTLFAHGEASDAFLHLWVMELANPTPFFGEMLERHSRPQTLAMLQLMADFLGQGVPVSVLVACMASVLGPALYQALLWPTLQHIVPAHPPMTEHWVELAEHCCRFSLAGLAAVRASLDGGSI